MADPVVRVAAVGDVHCRPDNADRIAAGFATLGDDADLLLIAGDLTSHGIPDEAAVLADALRDHDLPRFAVLGNHDHHDNRADEVTAALREGGITVLDRDHACCTVRDAEVGVVGTKGFVGGFVGSHLPDFGEPLLRAVYHDTGEEVQALEAGLAAVAHCRVRLVVLHYAPCVDTLAGEPEGIWMMLGSDRLAGPLREHEPSLVVHGHAHAGTFAGAIDRTPVHNVSLPLLHEPYHVFTLPVQTAAPGLH